MSVRWESRDCSAESLAEPLNLPFSGRTVPNRVLKAALTEHLATWDPSDRAASGVPGDALERLYRRWGAGGWGIILTGNVIVNPEHMEIEGNAMVPCGAATDGSGTELHQRRFRGFQGVATAAKSGGSLAIAQINHPGRQAFKRLQDRTISASDVRLGDHNVYGTEFVKPRAATLEDIKSVVDNFAHCAAYLEAAGFDGVELHAAHGYLLAQFMSRTTNLRTDEYGSSLENRTRIVSQIAYEIRKRCRSGFVLGIKLNSVEFQEHGMTAEEAKEICGILERDTFDFVELSGGTYEGLGWEHKKESTRRRESYFLQWADLIAPSVDKMQVFITGGFKTKAAMVEARKTVDGVGLGRAASQEPDLANKLLRGEVDGAMRCVFGDDELGMTNYVCGSQIMDIGDGRDPFDASVVADAEAFRMGVATYMDALGAGQWTPWPRLRDCRSG